MHNTIVSWLLQCGRWGEWEGRVPCHQLQEGQGADFQASGTQNTTKTMREALMGWEKTEGLNLVGQREKEAIWGSLCPGCILSVTWLGCLTISYIIKGHWAIENHREWFLCAHFISQDSPAWFAICFQYDPDFFIISQLDASSRERLSDLPISSYRGESQWLHQGPLHSDPLARFRGNWGLETGRLGIAFPIWIKSSAAYVL